MNETDKLTDQDLGNVAGGTFEGNERTVTVTAHNYESVIRSAHNVVIFAGMVYAGACTLIFKNVQSFSDNNKDVVIGVLEVDEDVNKPLVKTLGLNTIPHTLYYCDGVLVNRVVGVVSADQMNQAMKVCNK